MKSRSRPAAKSTRGRALRTADGARRRHYAPPCSTCGLAHDYRLGRRGRRHPLRRILHRQHPQPAHPPGLLPQRRRLPALVRGPRRPRAEGHQADDGRRLHRAAPADPLQALGQAAPRHHPHALRLAGHRPGHRRQPGPCRPRPEARRHQGQDAGAQRRGDQSPPRQHPDRARHRHRRDGKEIRAPDLSACATGR